MCLEVVDVHASLPSYALAARRRGLAVPIGPLFSPHPFIEELNQKRFDMHQYATWLFYGIRPRNRIVIALYNHSKTQIYRTSIYSKPRFIVFPPF